jgi:hypothetical protein
MYLIDYLSVTNRLGASRVRDNELGSNGFFQGFVALLRADEGAGEIPPPSKL